MTERLDAEHVIEYIETGQELIPSGDAPAPTLFNTDDPNLIIAKASGVAKVLKDVIVKQKMALKLGESEYIKVEGWTTLGALLGLCPKVEWTRPIDDTEGWEAAVVVVNGAGVELSRAEAQCTRTEKLWGWEPKNKYGKPLAVRDDFALRSMAQTRAMGKALRMPLGWIAVLAGYEATPAEEMPAVIDEEIPFDETGPQGPAAASGRTEAHGNASGTGASMTRAEANEARRAALQEQLHDLCGWLGVNEDDTAKLIAKDRLKNENKLPSHLTWLEKQMTGAEKAAEIELRQQELPL